MKKLMAAIFLVLLCSCSNNTNTTNSNSDSTHAGYDASKSDTTKVPDGVTSGNPESRDTSAMKLKDTTHR